MKWKYLQIISINYKYIHITWAYSETQADDRDGASPRNNPQKTPDQMSDQDLNMPPYKFLV